MDMTSVFAPITKSSPQEDGSLLVYGKATDSSLDLDQQICDANWLKTAMPRWFQVGNIREQHDARRAVGKATEYEAKDDGHYITAKIVDPLAKAKIEAGVLTGFSIGVKSPRIVKDASAPGGRINDGLITEVSIVDRACNEGCRLDLVKAAKPGWEGSPDDLDEERGLVRCEELSEKTVDSDDASDTDEVEKGRCGGGKKKTGKSNPDPNKPMPDASDEDEEEDDGEDDMDKTTGFDRDTAVALVQSTLDKASSDPMCDMPPEDLGVDVPPVAPPPELPDIKGAKAAIAIIAQLIVSEASEMVTQPNEDFDIQLLLQAVSALRQFICREKGEPACPPSADVCMGADADVTKGKYSAEQLRQFVKEGKAIPNENGDPSYPIDDVEDLDNAIHAVGRGGGSHDKIRRHIIRNAKRLGESNRIPDNWSSTGSSSKTTTVDATTPEPKSDSTKTNAPDTTKASGAADPDLLVKALTTALEDEESPLRKSFVSIVEASTAQHAESLTKAQDTLERFGERLATVEQMATPGGPALRRTETERNQARKADLILDAARFKALASNAEDLDLRRGYLAKASQLETQAKAL